jgi:hypothetical protein
MRGRKGIGVLPLKILLVQSRIGLCLRQYCGIAIQANQVQSGLPRQQR